MRAQGGISVTLPRRAAALLAAAFQLIRDHLGEPLSTGSSLALVARHFLDTWEAAVAGRRSRAQRIRERDHGWCQVPGCSHPATETHHLRFRSRGGGDEEENQIAVCAYHHHRCIHEGYLSAFGRAPDAITWFRGGVVWAGPGLPETAEVFH